ncbi:MAG: hypothetical protein SOZ50_06525 [Sodaliphilus sp.]|nr:hypothetical protein [Sodaliphilus sp.]
MKYHDPTGFGFFAEGERFLCFCFSPSSIYPLNPMGCGGFVKKMWGGGGNCGGNVYLCV